ncbi:hypothetical protein [uncultured Eubacterium sp.]|uniref:hypothetical protein n=1 Tax=uncultured Eubacterium sp. TaxID=165185 RepID=UPI003267F21F
MRTKDDFLPELILPMPKLSERFDELIAIMGYEEMNGEEFKTAAFAKIIRMLGLE